MMILRRKSRERTIACPRPMEMLLHVSDLLVNILRMQDFTEILDTHVATMFVGGIVLPISVDAPSTTAPFVLEPFV
jgi:hypothetical protein